MFDFVDKVENEPEDQQKDFEGLISKKLLFKIWKQVFEKNILTTKSQQTTANAN